METGVKKREWVKDAAIIFLAVLLVLTFFSNTIMNRSLPEVATAAVSSGSIVAKVRGSGIVTAAARHQVKAKDVRTIRSVMIKIGQQVNPGDVLFVLGEGDETALEQAKDNLRSLQTRYQTQALNVPTLNYSSYNRAIETAESNLARATEKRWEAESRLDNITSDPITSAAWERYQSAEEYVRQLETGYEQEKQNKLADLGSQIEEQYNLLDTAEQEAAWDEQLAEDARVSAEQAQYEADEAYRTWMESGSDGDYENYVNKQNEADIKQAKYEELSARTYEKTASITAKIAELEAEYQSWENDDAHYEEVRAAKDKAEKYYYEYSQLAGDLDDEYQAAVYAEQDAQVALDAAYQDLYYAQEQNARSVSVSQVELADIAEQIRIQQDKIRSLAGEEENVVTADVAGTIDTVDCTAGDTVMKDAILCTIEVPDMGHTLSFSVTNDQAQRLRIGDTATVSNYYWGNSVTATLTNIRTDPKNPQTSKVLTFDLTGDVTTGAEMTISVGQKSANYDLIVPNSAVKSDTNGSFVLAVSVKSSPLGNRYTAKRVSVEVLANDDNNSAIVADLSNGDYVITTSSAPVSNGDLVRMADNG